MPASRTVSRPSRRLLLLGSIAAMVAVVAVVRWVTAAYAERGLETASLEDLTALSRHRTDDARVFHFLGMRAASTGDAAGSLNAYWRAVQLAPDSEADWIGWATAARVVKGPAASDKILEAYLQKKPRSPRALMERARLYRMMEYPRSAFKYADEAARIDPTLVDAWGMMAEQAREFRDYGTAESAANHAISIAPTDWRGHLELGKAYLAERRTDAAIGSLRQAAALAPDRAVTHLYLGSGLLARARSDRDFESARTTLLNASRLQDQLGPHDRFTLLLLLGQCYNGEGDRKAALKPLLEAAAIEPGDETIHYTLARVYRGLGDKVNADRQTHIHQDIAQYHAAIRYLLLQIGGAPDDPAPRLKLARLYTSRGNPIDAAKTYKGMLSRGLKRDVAERELQALASSSTVNQR